MKQNNQEIRDKVKKEVNERLALGETGDGKKHTFNNGEIEVISILKPTCFVDGRLPTSEETRNKQSISAKKRGPNNRGKKLSDRARKNMSDSKLKFLRENPDWESPTQFKPGQEPWNTGLTKETDERVAIMAENYKKARPKGYTYDEETKIKKFEKEKNTRIKNSGTLENSYNNSTNKAVATREKHKEEDLDFLIKIREKSENTLIEKYGSLEEYYKVSIDNRNKTIIDNYGSFDNYYQILYKKQCDTKRTRGVAIGSTSKLETFIYNKLLEKFEVADIKRWYNEDPRYPWHCDFYIKSLDLFIEVNGYWTHGKHPFNKNSIEDLLILDSWISKQSTYINNKGYEVKNQFYTAIDIWTIIDPIKQKTAKENNLNYITLYSKEDISDFIRRIQDDSIKN